MSTKYPGGIISKTAPTPSGPYADSTAPGVWTLEQQAYWQKLGQWPTAGNVNPSAFIENLFSTYLYTGNGSTQTITNGIDLAGEGGLVWGKNRDGNWSHYLADTAQGTGKFLQSNTTSATQLDSTSLTAFNANGFSIGNAGAFINNNGVNYASWTFRKQPKFFDVVTYTGNGGTLAVNHSLASSPGCIIIKRTSNVASWMVYHRSLTDPTRYYLSLNLTNAQADWGSTWITATSTSFTLSGANGLYNGSGDTYVAYLFAHDAGGFGLTGTDNVISCGSYTGSGAAGNPITLGYEPQFLMVKNITTGGAGYNWQMMDTMRGMSLTSMQNLAANLSDAETSPGAIVYPTATGFAFNYGSGGWNGASQTYIYIAIRRGPMAVPTLGTSVFSPTAATQALNSNTSPSAGFPVDTQWLKTRNAADSWLDLDRLRGSAWLSQNSTSAETALSGYIAFDSMTSVRYTNNLSSASVPYIFYNLKRAPSFFDVVCGTSASSGQTWTNNHNLGVSPELVIMKTRGSASSPDDYWWVAQVTANKFGILNTNASMGALGSTLTVSATSFTGMVGYIPDNTTMVAYLFATCAGVSKVGSYTGTGATQAIDCGFTGGARFVLIKRTNATGDWCVWDTARGMVSGTDPRLFFNSTSAEYNNDWVYTTTGGFQIVTSDTNVNASGSTYIFLAIA